MGENPQEGGEEGGEVEDATEMMIGKNSNKLMMPSAEEAATFSLISTSSIPKSTSSTIQIQQQQKSTSLFRPLLPSIRLFLAFLIGLAFGLLLVPLISGGN
jgi:hypothetical protein